MPVRSKTCPKCDTKMELKCWLPRFDADEEGCGGYNVFQCPNCKNIEIES